MADSTAASLRSSCIKVYLCSNPDDSVQERRALRESIFPRLREHCRHTHRLDFRVIDPYEASDPRRWPDQQTRQQLLQECRESSAGPYLVALVGEQYGSVSLPAQVEVAEFQQVLQVCQREGISTHTLERTYLRDENTIPPSFCLQRPTHIRLQLATQTNEKTGDTEGLHEEEREDEKELRNVWQASVSQCAQQGLMTPERAHNFYRSALDSDLRFALENRPTDDIIKRCLVYVHKITNGKCQGDGKTCSESLSHPHPPLKSPMMKTDESFLSQLRDNFLPSLVASCQLLVYTTTSECDRHGYTPSRRRSYTEGLCQQLHSDLVHLIDSSVSMETGKASWLSGRHYALSRERAEQEDLCYVFSHLYEVIRPEEEQVRTYLEQRDTQHPLVVVGGPCTGKTVLLAHCAQQVKSWQRDRDPVVIIHFSNLSINSSLKHLLSSLCYQIAQSYSQPWDHSTRDHYPDPNTNPIPTLPQLRENLSSLLSLSASTKRPLVLILDSLDEVTGISGPQIIQCLPSPLPPNVKLLLSLSPTRTKTLHALRLHFPQTSASCLPEYHACVELGPVDKRGCVKMLESLLIASGRRVTSGQQAILNQALSYCPMTLYVRLLHRHALLWSSGSEVTESSLPVGIHTSITALLDHLEEEHGAVLVSHALSYLTLSRTGLTEAELTDLLSNNDEVLAGYVQHGEDLPSRIRVPEVEVEELLLDLKGFLLRRRVAETEVLFWVSRHFGLVVCKRYLSSCEVKREIHSAMADYFSGHWAYGRAKPLVITQNTGPNQRVPNTTQVKINIDRQTPGQSYVFNSVKPSSSVSSDHVQVNLRKLLELPFHLRQSNRWEDLENVLMSLGFHQAMLKAGLLGDLVSLLDGEEGVSQLTFPRERALLAGILKASACLLWSSPMELPMVIEVKLLPLLGVYPELEGYAKEVEQERRKRGSGLGVVLCPAPSTVPSIHCVLPETREIECPFTEVAGTECGTVVGTRADESAWLWKGREIEELILTHESKLKFVSVKSSGRFILLTTLCNRLFLGDMTGSESFQEIKATRRPVPDLEPDQNTISPMVEGFLVCDYRVGVWWKGESYVSVCGVSNSEPLTYLQCQNSVTSVSYTSGGHFVYCGQEKGTVSIFEMDNSSLIATCSSSTEAAFISVILCEHEEVMACVDGTGNTFSWDIATKTEPPKLIKNYCRDSSHFKLVNTDLSEESSILLVCETHQILLWDTCDWELWDQFLAPQGRAFTQAMLAQNGHLLLALLEACPSVLVWNMTTGQCVLSLDTSAHSQPLTLFKTKSTLSAVTKNGSLTVWDSELIHAAGLVPKTGAGVRDLVVEAMGEWFYSIDGSETVSRWGSRTGSPVAHFLHNDPVEKLCLSPDGCHLVTLSGGNIYVWQSETGHNVIRIHGSQATNVLITHNSNLGVCLSECGLSRVWKLRNGGVVCNIHLYLADSQISPESTFLIGRHQGDLLAVSLWSGSVSKRFSCSECSESVLAFQTLPEHPDYVVVIAASGTVYTWRVTEETLYRQFQLPQLFLCQPQVFQMSSDGSYALMSIDDDVITLLDFSCARMCSVKSEGPVLKVCLDNTGHYAIYIFQPLVQHSDCACDLHSKPVLTVVRLADGSRVGMLCLCKTPSTLSVCEDLCVYVGFQDGSVGVYSISDATKNGGAVRGRINWIGQQRSCPCDHEPLRWLPLATPTTTWV